MQRSIVLALTLVVSAAAAGSALAQQPVVTQGPVRVAQPTRSYRSYSVRPSAATMGDVRPTGRHAGEATWRHATAKAAGHYQGGR